MGSGHASGLQVRVASGSCRRPRRSRRLHPSSDRSARGSEVTEGTVARELLAHGRSMVDRYSAGTRGVWPRAAALLVRQALEVALRTYWSAKAHGLEEAPMRAQLLCLDGTLNDADVGRR